MLSSSGDTSRVLTCSLGWKVCRALSSSRVAFRESSDKKKSFQGLSLDAVVMSSWKQEGSGCWGTRNPTFCPGHHHVLHPPSQGRAPPAACTGLLMRCSGNREAKCQE